MLILVKHAMPVLSAGVAPRDWPLADSGRRQCLVLAGCLAPYKPDIVITSDEPKAAESGSIVAAQLGLPLATARDLHEHERTGVRLLPTTAFERLVQEFFHRPGQLVFGNETAEDAAQRFETAVKGLLRQHRASPGIVVVAHGTVISLLVSRATGCDPFLLWRRLGLPSFVVLSRPRLHLLDLVDCSDQPVRSRE